MIKVLSVLPLENAIELYKKKFVENYPTFPNLSNKTLNILQYAMLTKRNYDNIPVLGLCKIYGEEPSLSENWEDILDFLPAKPGNIYFEIHIEEDECLFINKDNLFKFELLNRRVMARDKRAAVINKILEKCNLTSDINADDVVVLLPGVSLEKCKFFCKLDNDWNQADMRRELSLDMLDNLKVF